ncbi:MAG: flagellar export protein FliJ [Oleiphilus sp.]
MKKKSERLSVVLELALRNENKALDELNKKRRYRDQQLEQVESLKHYQGQYLSDMKQGVSQVNNAQSLQANLQFLSQIDAAINQQSGVLDIAENEFQQALKVWTELHQKRKGMADLIEKYQKQEVSAADKKEQQQIESDFLARKYRS